MKKVLLDTDIGTDIDDAVCLAYLLAQKECELLGITVVGPEPEKRAMLASSMCKVAGKDIPIHTGAIKPLIAPIRQEGAHQARALDRWEHDKEFTRAGAIEFMRQTIRKYPGEVSLLAIGPLTNIALLFCADPEIPELLGELVIMCGVFTDRLPGVGPLEYNAVCDPHATAIVYNAPVRKFRSIGLDVTCQATMSVEEVYAKFQTKLLYPVIDFAKVWFERSKVITYHDPMAATVIFDDEICTFHRGNVDVNLVPGDYIGQTLWHSDPSGGRHEIALEVDCERFYKHYFSVFNET